MHEQAEHSATDALQYVVVVVVVVVDEGRTSLDGQGQAGAALLQCGWLFVACLCVNSFFFYLTD